MLLGQNYAIMGLFLKNIIILMLIYILNELKIRRDEKKGSFVVINEREL